jgi:hypothetical protein
VALSGPDGWVSCRYLVASNDDFYRDDSYGRDRYVRPNVSIQFGFGTNNRRGWDDNDHRDRDRDRGDWNNGPGWFRMN